MKTKLSFSILIIGTILFLAFSSNPPNGKTGAPGENTCSQCHSPSNPNFNGTFEINGLPTDAIGGSTYTVTVLATDLNMNANRAGFQITALDEENNAIGTFANPSAGSTVTSSGDRIYHEHNPAQSFSGGTASWTVDWTIPETGINDGELITFYGASVIGNGSGTANDLVVTAEENTTYEAPIVPLSVEIIDIENPLCTDDNNGSATAVPQGGEGNYTYNWSNGEMTATAFMLPSGSNSVTVTDAINDEVSAIVILSNPDPIIDNLVLIDDVECFGESTGNIFINPSGGTGNLMYLWNTGTSDANLLNASAGIYMLTITDENSCSEIFEYEVNEPDSPFSVNITETEPIPCFNFFGSLVAVPSSPANTVIWSNNVTNLANTGIVAGGYSVTVTDANGCSATDSDTLNQPELITLDFDITNPTTGDNGSITVNPSGGTPDYNIMWSTNETTETINDLSAGDYGIVVTDANNCQAVDNITLINGCTLSLMDSIFVNNTCAGDSSAAIGVVVSGQMGDITYQWSTGDTITELYNLPAGIYTVTVSDEADCTAETSIQIDEILPISIDFIVGNDNDQPDSLGFVLTNVSNGTAPYSYVWSTNDTIDNITNLAQGIYYVTVTDDNDCVQIDSIEILEIACILDASVAIDIGPCANDLSSAELIINNSSGDVFSQFLPLEADPLALTAGDYSFFLQDSLQCKDTIEFSIDSIDILQIESFEILNTSCEDTLGFIEIVIVGGIKPYDIEWSNGDSTVLADSLMEGIYTVEITDAIGCTISSNFQIFNNISSVLTYSVSTVEIYLDDTGNYHDSIDLSPFIEILTASCEDSIYFITDSIMADCSMPVDTFTSQAYIYNFNEPIDTIEISVIALDTIPPSFECSQTEPSIISSCGPETVFINLSFDDIEVIDNCGATISNNDTTLFFNITKDDTLLYDIIAVDSSGNTFTCTNTYIIVYNELPVIEVETYDISCFGEADGCIILSVSNLPPSPADTLCNLAPGTYEFTINDLNGCPFDTSVTINEPEILSIEETAKGNETAGDSDGFIDVTITGGNPPYSFEWTENGQVVSTNEDLINFPSSQYRLTVTDSLGCTTMLTTFIDLLNASINTSIDFANINPTLFDNSLIIKDLQNETTVLVYNSMGIPIFTLSNHNASTFEISTINWSAGIYFARVSHMGKEKMIKLIKQ